MHSTDKVAHVKNAGMRRKPRDPKKTKTQHLLEIIRVLGLTTTSSKMLATAPGHDLVAYAAGSIAVLYDYKKNKQTAFLYAPPQPSSVTPSPQTLTTPSPYGSPQWSGSSSELDTATTGKNTIPIAQRPKSISCMRFSRDGSILAVGESGHTPRILIWDVKAQSLIADLKGHKFGVLALEFSPDGKVLVSLGFQHDGYLNVWDWRKGTILACNRVTSKVNALAFSMDGSYFVTAGVRHIKFWYFKGDKGGISKQGSPSDARILDGHSGILGELHDNNFVDCATDGERDSENTYFVTQSGLLCMFSQGRVMEKWVNLQVKRAFSIHIDDMRIVVSCTDGIVRLFEVKTLKYQGTLPKPHPRVYDLAAPLTSQPSSTDDKTEETYPDTVAVRYDRSSGKLVCVYSDRSLVIWDIKDTNQILKLKTLSGHEGCVWGTEIYSPQQNSRNPKPLYSSMPLNTFITYSADGTARFWNLDLFQRSSSSTLTSSRSTSSMKSSNSTKRSHPAKELLKVLYVDPKCAEYLRCLEPGSIEPDENAVSSADFGIHSLRVSPDGKYMATGDKRGNLRVHDTRDWSELTYQEAHESEILAIDFTNSEFRPPENDVQTRIPYLLATASRDRLLRIFSVDDDFRLIQTLDDHSSSITGLRFSKGGQVLLSCSADKSVIFRSLYGGDQNAGADAATALENLAKDLGQGGSQPDISPTYNTYHNHSGKSTVFDVDVDSSHRFCYAVMERRVQVLEIDNGKLHQSHKPELADEPVEMGGSLQQVNLDPISYTFAVTSGSDKAIRLFDLVTGTCIGRFIVHAELITCVKFMEVRGIGEDGRGEELRLISTCSDGSIYVWRVAEEIRLKMVARRDERLQKSPSDVVDVAPFLQQEVITPLLSLSLENPPRKLSTPSIISEGTFIPVTSANTNNVNSRMRKSSGNSGSGSPDHRRRVSPPALDQATLNRAAAATTSKTPNNTNPKRLSGSGPSSPKTTVPLSSPVSSTQRTTRVRSSRASSDSRHENTTKLPNPCLLREH